MKKKYLRSLLWHTKESTLFIPHPLLHNHRPCSEFNISPYMFFQVPRRWPLNQISLSLFLFKCESPSAVLLLYPQRDGRDWPYPNSVFFQDMSLLLGPLSTSPSLLMPPSSPCQQIAALVCIFLVPKLAAYSGLPLTKSYSASVTRLDTGLVLIVFMRDNSKTAIDGFFWLHFHCNPGSIPAGEKNLHCCPYCQ